MKQLIYTKALNFELMSAHPDQKSSTLDEYLDLAKQKYAELKTKVESTDYNKLVSDAQKFGETALTTAKDVGQDIGKGFTNIAQSLIQPIGLMTNDHLQSSDLQTYSIATQPHAESVLSEIQDNMDLAKGIRTNGKILIEYTDKSSKQNVQMLVNPDVLEYMSPMHSDVVISR